tara:strand:+ start:732 stop:932 length:201 start_codon:yes stop_codon:yes gene_type:complete
MTNNELRTAIDWTEARIKEVDKSSEEIRAIGIRIDNGNKEIQRLKGLIGWQNNRSRQARTICERGF